MWHTMLRVGAIHMLDYDDYNPANEALEVIHPPETGTPLKRTVPRSVQESSSKLFIY